MQSDQQKDMCNKLDKSIEGLVGEFRKIRTGRAHSSLLDHIKVESYGSKMPLSQVANVHAQDARTLLVSPWDKSQVQACEKAIRNSDLGLNPAVNGSTIHVPLPVLTEERRRDMVKLIKEIAEQGKVAIRNIRRAQIQDFKDKLKNKEIGEDDEKRACAEINKIIETYIEKVDKALAEKEGELTQV